MMESYIADHYRQLTEAAMDSDPHYFALYNTPFGEMEDMHIDMWLEHLQYQHMKENPGMNLITSFFPHAGDEDEVIEKMPLPVVVDDRVLFDTLGVPLPRPGEMGFVVLKRMENGPEEAKLFWESVMKTNRFGQFEVSPNTVYIIL